MPAGSTLVRETLDGYGRLARDAMLAFLPVREPRAYLYDLIADYPRRGGRGMRPALHIAAAKAHGASLEQAMATAVSIELLHNSLLVLDDIQDSSEQRRGQPTLHRQHGIPMAMNAGSSMSILSLVPLLRNVGTNGPELALWLFESAIEMAQHCAEGQAMELGWRQDNRNDVTPAEYFDMVLRKTCSYSTIFPIRAGAMVGLRVREVDPALLRYAYLVGAAFQAQDDYLNVAGARASYGKEACGDLYEGKRTLLTITLTERCTDAERRFVCQFMGLPRTQKTPDQVARVVDLLRRYDCLEHTRATIQRLVGAAQAEFDRGFAGTAASLDREFLRQFPRWVIEQS